jgi:hypothetical protein
MFTFGDENFYKEHKTLVIRIKNPHKILEEWGKGEKSYLEKGPDDVVYAVMHLKEHKAVKFELIADDKMIYFGIMGKEYDWFMNEMKHYREFKSDQEWLEFQKGKDYLIRLFN